METADYFRKAVQHYLENKPRGAQTELARATGINKIHLNDFLGGRRVLKEHDRLKITTHLNIDYLEFLLFGRALIKGEKNEKLQIDRPLIIQTTKESEANFIDTEHYRAIPLYASGRLSAFSGGMPFDVYEQADDYVMVYLPELQGRSKHKLVAARVGGDSMAPLIPKNSIVVIDLSDRELFDHRIYAINWNDDGVDEAAIKRIRLMKDNKCCVLLSENPDYLPEVVEKDWDQLCIGRVVWMWRSLLEG